MRIVIKVVLLILAILSVTRTLIANAEGGEVVEAQLLRVGRELRGESIRAPGSKTYILTSDGMLPYEAVDIRVSHLSIPPAKFTFSVSPFPDDGSVSVKRRNRKLNLRDRRRRLDTAITTVTAGKSGGIILNGMESPRMLLTVNVVPTGVKPGGGTEKEVEVRYNIIMERKIINNAIPETATRMIMFALLSLVVSAFFIVPMLSATLWKGDELINRGRREEDKRIS